MHKVKCWVRSNRRNWSNYKRQRVNKSNNRSNKIKFNNLLIQITNNNNNSKAYRRTMVILTLIRFNRLKISSSKLMLHFWLLKLESNTIIRWRLSCWDIARWLGLQKVRLLVRYYKREIKVMSLLLKMMKINKSKNKIIKKSRSNKMIN